MSKTIDKIRKLLSLAANEGAAVAEADTARQLADAVATLDEALAQLRAVMPLATAEERRELTGILLGDVEIGAEALSATVHLPAASVSLAPRSGSSSWARERRAPAGRIAMALPRAS